MDAEGRLARQLPRRGRGPRRRDRLRLGKEAAKSGKDARGFRTLADDDDAQRAQQPSTIGAFDGRQGRRQQTGAITV